MLSLKGHGNEAEFLGLLHKSVRHWSLTLHFEPFRFWLRIRGDICNRKTTTFQERTPFICPLRVPIHPRFNSLYSLWSEHLDSCGL
jgi:hypothetical protein